MTLGRELAALPDHALAPRLAALRWSDFHLDLADHIPPRSWSSLKLHLDPHCEVGLFFLPRGQRIPLHDHPRLRVWMRVLAGRVQVTSYTWHTPPLAHRSVTTLDPDSPVWLVDHARDNLHELLAEDDLAFLDVLRPPYIDGRVCTYYTATPADHLWQLRPIP
ncbi:MAG: hypothetical protein IPO88_33365 [Nannocystis sp.]|uniref:hypothetical protein n=1 Tax=Nannocystis sp. TaxID=1962667 RepID=UPI00242669BC|nr:hypothetical protein [Nannocystis sp.]MBK9758322.1 hypothetical protein [Nannocystis sp.]